MLVCISAHGGSTVARSCAASEEEFPRVNAGGDLFENAKVSDWQRKQTRALSCTKHVRNKHVRTGVSHAQRLQLTPPLELKGCVFVWRNAVGRHSLRAEARPWL